MKFLFDELESEFGKRKIKTYKKYPFVNDNLNPRLKLREYQQEALNRFYLYYENNDVDYFKPSVNIHLCFNMATGSGKTVIMSGLMLYLYNQGYRNFLFFVNRGQIVEKTKDNFSNIHSNKYLFNEKIFINKEIKIKTVDNFSYSSEDDINICFTTIQGLFSDIHNEKENSLTIEDFKNKKIALIADEAHHINSSTKNKNKEKSLFDEVEENATWENTVGNIFSQNPENILLEFTATLELDNQNVKDKYLDKIIYKYNLKDFVNDRYSKKIDLLKSDTTKNQRILQALLVSIYREEIAIKYGLNIKPVVLLKSSKIAESIKNQEEFHKQLEKLSPLDLSNINKNTNVAIFKKIFIYFKENSITLSEVCEKIQIAFDSKRCICTNNNKELDLNQKLLNSLEDKSNPIRAIFTVDKLNEGWDVLNLFDIVRLYEGQNTGGSNKGKVGKKTISEAQLVGRGARYCPFRLKEHEELFQRKYDLDITNELRILEELYFHSENENRYISEIKRALIEQGLIDEDKKAPIELTVKLKEEHDLDTFKNKKIFLNKRNKKNYHYVKNLRDFGVASSNFKYELKSGKGSLVDIFDDQISEKELNTQFSTYCLVDFLGINIMNNALLFHGFFTLSNLKQYLPNLKSIQCFINDKDYLKQFEIDILGELKKITSVTSREKINIALSFLTVLENEMKNNIIHYEGTEEFLPYSFGEVFTSKVLLIPKDEEDNTVVVKDNWFVFDKFYGTSEEKRLIELIGSLIESIKVKYKENEIYLVRNERHFKIYDFEQGRAFEPDFVLFVKNKDDNSHFQFFIEPKGEYLVLKDKWKEDFLLEIKTKLTSRSKDSIVDFENEEFRIVGLKFYNNKNENEFKKQLENELSI